MYERNKICKEKEKNDTILDGIVCPFINPLKIQYIHSFIISLFIVQIHIKIWCNTKQDTWRHLSGLWYVPWNPLKQRCYHSFQTSGWYASKHPFTDPTPDEIWPDLDAQTGQKCVQQQIWHFENILLLVSVHTTNIALAKWKKGICDVRIWTLYYSCIP